jgi:Fe-S-cluster containining protein
MKSAETPGKMERGLKDLWKKAGSRVYHPRYFIKTLRLRRHFDLNMVGLHQVTVEVPAGQVPDCDSCVEVCCTGPNAVVSLRLNDIARLVDAGRGAHVIPSASPSPEGLRGARLPVISQARENLDESLFSRVFPVLARDVTGTCTLLTEDRLCGAYPQWPLSCSRYPYAFDQVKRRVFWASGCGSREVIAATESAGQVRSLVKASLRSYNERIKDVILLHVALPELKELGFLTHLRLEGYLAKAAARAKAPLSPGDAHG